MKEKRLGVRFLCADLVQVDWVTGDGGECRRAQGVLEDISTVGARVQVEEAIPPGVLIAISRDDIWMCGSVTYCVYQEYGYFVGVHFADDTRWSSTTFRPQHLTNLAALVRSPCVEGPEFC
jgi:hypothetical protein